MSEAVKQASPSGTLTASSKAQSRLLFIDMFRGLVTLIMIEGHVTNITILNSLRGTKKFHYLDILNGMVAPSFIFIAGFAFALALQKKWRPFLAFEKPFWLQVRRLLFILAVGFWLHLPTWSFWSMLRLSKESILYALRCDVLQLIALSLLITLFLAVTLRRQDVLRITMLVLGLTIVFTTPFVYMMEPRNFFPVLVSDYINVNHYALFPLFPWAAYSFLGTFLCALYLRLRGTPGEKKFFIALTVLGILMFLAGFGLFYVPWQYHIYVDPSKSSPRLFMLKMGFIFYTLAGYWFYEQKWKPEKSLLNIVGQESLLVYAFHLVLVYGASFMPTFLAQAVGPSLTYLPSLFISFVVISVSAAVGIGWHYAKKNYPRGAKAFFYALVAIYFIRFFAYKY
jgi:uncharacterized membrane protein